MKNHLKYPIWLFGFVLISKFAYIVLESFYNYHVLMVTTDPTLSRQTIESLNENGHMLAAVGITLLCIPLLYALVKWFRYYVIYLFMLCYGVYYLSFHGLNVAVDKIVEYNKEKRHDAYYLNVVKYGILNDIIHYDDLLKHKKVQDDNLMVNDRIFLLSSFLLLDMDKELIKKLKKRGEGRVAALYTEQNINGDYETQYNAFKSISDKISELWTNLNNHRKELLKEHRRIKNSSLSSRQKREKLKLSTKMFYKQLENEIGENDLKLNTRWRGYIRSQYIKNFVKENLHIEKDQDAKILLKIIESKILTDFREKVYLPRVRKNVNNMTYKPNDFDDNGKAVQAGDDAIKLLYIPAFALSLSMIALLSNIVTVITMILSLFKISNLTNNMIKISLFSVFLALPFLSSSSVVNHKLLTSLGTKEKIFFREVAYYINLNSILHRK